MVVEALARFGYASKAFIYAVVGLLAAAAALNRGGAVTDTSGALRVILARPFGNVALLLLAAGLLGYALWRILDAIFDPEHHGRGLKGLGVRGGRLLRAAAYGGLGIEAIRLANGLRGSRGGDARIWAARVMDVPFGDWLIGLVGVGIAIYGMTEIVDAWQHRTGHDLDTSSLAPKLRGPLLSVSRFGVAARAAILVVIGVFLVRAALAHDPRQAHGTRESTVELAGMVEGRWLLAIVALGLMAYAVDQALHARCRRIRSPIG